MAHRRHAPTRVPPPRRPRWLAAQRGECSIDCDAPDCLDVLDCVDPGCCCDGFDWAWRKRKKRRDESHLHLPRR